MLRFAIIGDLHVGGVAEEVQTTIELVNARELDFVLFLGDLTNKPTDENIAEFVRQVRRIEHPVYLTIGNHDTARCLEGFDFEKALAGQLPGPWSDGFTYEFHAGGWKFIVCSLADMQMDYKGPQINRIKGMVSENGGMIHVPPPHLVRFGELLEASGQTPTVVVMHVPLVRMAARTAARGCYAQVRLLEEWQITSMVEQRPNVKMCLYGHDHFNQAEVVNDRLHLITQGVRGMWQYEDTSAIRLMEIDDSIPARRGSPPSRSTVRSRLIWSGRDGEAPGELGTSLGDIAFEWTVPDRPFVYPRVQGWGANRITWEEK